MSQQPVQIDINSKNYSTPETVRGGFLTGSTEESYTPSFFTVVNNAGLSNLAYNGHFGASNIDPSTKEIISFPEAYSRINSAFGSNDEVVVNGEKKPALMIVESIKEKADGREKTVPLRIYQAELIQPTKEGENASLKIIRSINLRDGTGVQSIKDGPTVQLDESGKLNEKGAKNLRDEINWRSGDIAQIQGGDSVSDERARMAAAISKALDEGYIPSNPEGYQGPATTAGAVAPAVATRRSA